MTTSYLLPLDIESLALTMNKFLTLTCLPLLEPLFARRHHAEQSISRFGPFVFDNNVPNEVIEHHRELFGIPASAELIDPRDVDRMHSLDYLRLNGDLHWLGPLDSGTDMEMQPHKTSEVTTWQLEELQQAATKANVKLPPAFVKFISNKSLMDRIPSSTANFFDITGGLRKVPAAIDGGTGGYNVCMYSDQQGGGYWNLYLVPGEEGAHCVLASGLDTGDEWEDMSEDEQFDEFPVTVDERVQAEREGCQMARMMKDDLTLEGWDFESWLAGVYFEQWLWFMASKEKPRDYEELAPLKEYVRNVYVRDPS